MPRDIYEKFQRELATTRPHTKENKAVKRFLGEWLCSYQEVRMIEAATRLAEEKNGVLIYRN